MIIENRTNEWNTITAVKISSKKLEPKNMFPKCIFHSRFGLVLARTETWAVLADLPKVFHSAGAWHMDEDNLLQTAEGATFWKLQGYRIFLKSAALAAGESSDRTNYRLGTVFS